MIVEWPQDSFDNNACHSPVPGFQRQTRILRPVKITVESISV